MTHPTASQDSLRIMLGTLLSQSSVLVAPQDARINTLEEEIREAESCLMRRASRHERDRACYRLGAAFEPTDDLGLDDVALTGWLHGGIAAIALLAETALKHPTLSVGGMLRILFENDENEVFRARGVWVRWRWLAALYQKETVDFLKTRKARMAGEPWRREQVSARQHHLVREISRYLQIVAPTFVDRGGAFEWIKEKGGNPRFRDVPPPPPLPSLKGL